MPFFGIILLKPQNVSGPPPAAVNNNAAAGAVPIPNKISNATSGISNKRGTFINIPIVDAMTMPIISLPRNFVTIDGLSHCIIKPLANPATIIIGPIRNK